MLKEVLEITAKTTVSIGTGIITRSYLDMIANNIVPKKNGVIGVAREVCVDIASIAISFKVADIMGDKAAEMVEEGFDYCEEMMKNLNEMSARIKRKDISPITNKEEPKDGKEESAGTENPTETSGD
jgi:hypothetical protein